MDAGGSWMFEPVITAASMASACANSVRALFTRSPSVVNRCATFVRKADSGSALTAMAVSSVGVSAAISGRGVGALSFSAMPWSFGTNRANASSSRDRISRSSNPTPVSATYEWCHDAISGAAPLRVPRSNPATLSAVAETAPLRVQLIAKTDFLSPPDVPWSTDADGGSALVEFTGRACYQSWSKPNPRTATNTGYIRHIIDVGHFSVLEHASVSFYITGISRSCTHELIRHRHFSYSQLSQRYVPENDSQVVLPPGIEDDPELSQILTAAADASRAAYTELLARLEAKFADQPNAVLRRKQARQAARAVLPNATETRIVVTGNYRAWRHFIAMRASEHADVEIRRLAIACLRQLVDVAPAVFADFEVTTLADGSEVATSPLATEA